MLKPTEGCFHFQELQRLAHRSGKQLSQKFEKAHVQPSSDSAEQPSSSVLLACAEALCWWASTPIVVSARLHKLKRSPHTACKGFKIDDGGMSHLYARYTHWTNVGSASLLRGYSVHIGSWRQLDRLHPQILFQLQLHCCRQGLA